MFRVPADGRYTATLGRAVYNFAYYEWVVIWTVDRLESGYVDRYSSDPRGITSGNVASDFSAAIDAASSLCPELRDSLRDAAVCFAELVHERNRLIHAHPYTAEGGEQQLLYSGRLPRIEWELRDVEEVAARFDAAAATLNELFYRLAPRAGPA